MSEIEVQKERWKKVLDALGKEAEDFCAVGGGAIWLYLPNEIDAARVRPTEDVDFVVPSKTLGEYHKLEQKLRKLGFRNDTRAGAPICRYVYKGITVDFMPARTEVLNLNSRWFEKGLKKKRIVEISKKHKLGIFPLAYFLASKFDAFQDRGRDDPRLSDDLEDICVVLSCLENYDELFQDSDKEVTSYLKDQLKQMSEDPTIREAVYGHVGDGKQADRLIQKISNLLK